MSQITVAQYKGKNMDFETEETLGPQLDYSACVLSQAA